MNNTSKRDEHNVTQSIHDYVEVRIIPLYDNFDKAHQRDHVRMVISQSMDLAAQLDVDAEMVYVIAAYHDIGLCEGREHHHEVSARMLLADKELRKWFMESQLQTMAEAVEDHRASSDHAPRSLYGRIVAEADRFIDPDTIVHRTVQYGMEHYPELDKGGALRADGAAPAREVRSRRLPAPLVRPLPQHRTAGGPAQDHR